MTALEPSERQGQSWFVMRWAAAEVGTPVFSEWGLCPAFLALLAGVFFKRWEVASFCFLFLLTGLVNLAVTLLCAKRLSAACRFPGFAFPAEKIPVALEVDNAGPLPVPECRFVAVMPPSMSLEREGQVLPASEAGEAPRPGPERAKHWEHDRFWPSDGPKLRFSARLDGLGQKGRLAMDLAITARKRGVYSFPEEVDFTLQVGDLMGIYRTRVAVDLGKLEKITVFPRILGVGQETAVVAGFEGESSPFKSSFEDPLAPVSLRSYLPSHRARDINWKASALGQGLKSNVFASTVAGTVIVGLDVSGLHDLREEIISAQRLGRPFDADLARFEALFERMVSLAASVFVDSLDRGCEAGLVTNSPPAEPGGIPPGKGDRHALVVMEALASLDPYRPGFPRSAGSFWNAVAAFGALARVIVIRAETGEASPGESGPAFESLADSGRISIMTVQ